MARTQREEFEVEGLPPALSHYADAVRFGDLLFVSGVTALGPDQRVAGEGDVVRQAQAVFEGLAKILEAARASFADVLKVTVFLVDVEDRARINPVRQAFFGPHKPASTLIGVKALALPGLLIEIEAVVGLPQPAGARPQQTED